jgi:hypothetical protein
LDPAASCTTEATISSFAAKTTDENKIKNEISSQIRYSLKSKILKYGGNFKPCEEARFPCGGRD